MSVSQAIPRRWSVEVDGIKWLPRLIDKARMRESGKLGSYLVGHSPVDYAFLTKAGIGTDDFVALAVGQGSDADVLAALRARGFDEAAVRAWSDRFETTYKVYIFLWDVDEGYRVPSPLEKLLIPVARRVEGPLMDVVRFVRPKP
jgi:hypothetical protein